MSIKKPTPPEAIEKLHESTEPYTTSLNGGESIKLIKRAKILSASGVGVLVLGVMGLIAANRYAYSARLKYEKLMIENGNLVSKFSYNLNTGNEDKRKLATCLTEEGALNCYKRADQILPEGICEFVDYSYPLKDQLPCQVSGMRSDIGIIMEKNGINEDTACLERRRLCLQKALHRLNTLQKTKGE